MNFFRKISEVNKESVEELIDNISMREEYVHALIDDFDIQWEDITYPYKHYSEEELSDMSIFIHNHLEDVCGRVASFIISKSKEMNVHMAARILIFCLFDEIDEEEGHILADDVLVALIDHLLTDKTEADKIENLYCNIDGWYS